MTPAWNRPGSADPRNVRCGLHVSDERGIAVSYMICEPASHCYQVMTRSDRMPVLVEERI